MIIAFAKKNTDQIIKGEIVPALIGKDGRVFIVVKAEDGRFHRIYIDEYEPV